MGDPDSRGRSGDRTVPVVGTGATGTRSVDINPDVSATVTVFFCPMCGAQMDADQLARQACDGCGAESVTPRAETHELTADEVLRVCPTVNEVPT
jgi:hypothetical protein